MKTFILSTAFIVSCISARAQLANTRWSGTLAVPSSTNVTLDFKTDTVYLINQETQDILETMTYAIKNNVLTLKKLSGGSPCEIGSAATMTCVVKDNQLNLKLIQDACNERASAWMGEPFKKE